MINYLDEIKTESAFKAMDANLNINILGGVIALLEGGTTRNTGQMEKTKQRIIKLCEGEQQRQLVIYDKAMGRKETL